MKFSEVPLMQSALYKHAGTVWSEVFELVKLGYSDNKKAVYVRKTFGMPGQDSHGQHFWRDVEDMDSKYVLFDTTCGA
jgi:hypothetical protein